MVKYCWMLVDLYDFVLLFCLLILDLGFWVLVIIATSLSDLVAALYLLLNWWLLDLWLFFLLYFGVFAQRG